MRNIWFEMDGAPVHFTRGVRALLDEEYGRNWIGRGHPQMWPPRSPELTPLDFFVWRTHVKIRILNRHLFNRYQAVAATITLDMFGRVHTNTFRSAEASLKAEGRLIVSKHFTPRTLNN